MPHTKIDRLLAIVYEIYMHKIYTLVIHTIFGFSIICVKLYIYIYWYINVNTLNIYDNWKCDMDIMTAYTYIENMGEI